MTTEKTNTNEVIPTDTEVEGTTDTEVEGTTDIEPSSKSESGRDSAATRAIRYVIDANVELFHTPAHEPFARIHVGDHIETHATNSTAFRRWVERLYFERETKGLDAASRATAIGTLEGIALFDGDEAPVYVRIAETGNTVHIDIGTSEWNAIEIDAAGWRIVEDPPVRFRRPPGLLPLPTPQRGGSVTLLEQCLNLPPDDADHGADRRAVFMLEVAWLVAALRGRGPYPVLAFVGEQGTAKSTQARILRRLVDPNEADLRTASRDEHDLVIAATHGHVIALDNVSRLADWLSDAICRVATGSGFATRTLYTTGEETIFSVQRPQILNGIEDFVVRGDLLDRAIPITLQQIPDAAREEESRLWARFARLQPLILGALYDAVSSSLANEATTVLDAKPRMADFAVRVEAAAPALGWAPGEFIEVYTANRDEANDVALDSSPLTPHLRQIVKIGDFDGTWNDLLKTLDARVDEKTQKSPAWPKTPRALSGQIRRIAPNLRAAGIDVDPYRAGDARHTRRVRIQPSEPSEPSETLTQQGLDVGRSDRAYRPNGAQPSDQPSDVFPSNSNGSDGSDGSDGHSPTHLGETRCNCGAVAVGVSDLDEPRCAEHLEPEEEW